MIRQLMETCSPESLARWEQIASRGQENRGQEDGRQTSSSDFPVPHIPVQFLRAAIRRSDSSLLLKCVLRDNLLDRGGLFFDYGCGHGDDIRHLQGLGFDCDGWDPVHRPDVPRRPADTVNLGYVLNVIEDLQERAQTLRDAWLLCRKILVVAARISVGDGGEFGAEYGDGVLAKIAELGRVPFPDEWPETGEVINALGSLKRAFALIRRVTGDQPWTETRQQCIDDLTVYLALSRFRKRPPLSALPLDLQRDIREFFGTYKRACESADAILFQTGDPSKIDQACRESPVGRLTSNALLVHKSALEGLTPLLRIYEGCARAYLGEIDDANIVKLHRFSGKVSYLACPEFDEVPHRPSAAP